MEAVHLAIGVTGVVALFVVMITSVSQVTGQIAEQTGAPVSNLLSRGGPVTDQLTAVGEEAPLVEGDGMDATCSAVQCISGKACALVGPYMPKRGSKRASTIPEEEAAEKMAEPEPAASEPPEAEGRQSEGREA